MSTSVLAFGVVAMALAVVVGVVAVGASRRSVQRQGDADMESCLTNLDRLRAIDESGLLDGLPRPELDALTRRAAEQLEAPVALMSIVGADRQFFASHYGLEGELATVRETALDHSYCKHVVASDAPLVVSDAERHPKVRDSFAITGAARAYLGVPLRTDDGHVLGSFCVVDNHPRDWDAEDRRVLQGFADSALALSGS